MKFVEGRSAPGVRSRTRDPLAVSRARLAMRSAARGALWAVLTVSLLGTAVTAPYLPTWCARPVLVLSVLGGVVSGVVAVYRLFVAFMASLGLIRHAVPARLGARASTTERTAGSRERS
ncbi:hypothetical protein [Streptomyces sp. RKAG337]|uniref:hypothetical protein n=1 Tax=Streptomyces sp. RKAG337 TaxID=2893404 RepID=UPI0020343685|nr:hypothetical protein [Streptomyces sp. RKAG337]MCM2430960.1 hypothetical protein [Streptomyces sp. RKAG337]